MKNCFFCVLILLLFLLEPTPSPSTGLMEQLSSVPLAEVEELVVSLESSSTVDNNILGVTKQGHHEHSPRPLTHQEPWFQGVRDLWRTPKHPSLFLDAWEDMSTGPQSPVKTPDPKQQRDSLSSPFLSESPRCSVHICTHSLTSVNSVLTSSWLEVAFYPTLSQGPTLGPPGPSQPASFA